MCKIHNHICIINQFYQYRDEYMNAKNEFMKVKNHKSKYYMCKYYQLCNKILYKKELYKNEHVFRDLSRLDEYEEFRWPVFSSTLRRLIECESCV